MGRGGGGGGSGGQPNHETGGPDHNFFLFKIKGALQEKTQIRPRLLVLVNIIITCLPLEYQVTVLKRVQRWRVS